MPDSDKWPIKADAAQSVYKQPIASLTYQITDGTILEADKSSLDIQAVTSVKKGYAVGIYTDAVTISYKKNGNYQITTVPADYEVTDSSLTVTAEGYTGFEVALDEVKLRQTAAYDKALQRPDSC